MPAATPDPDGGSESLAHRLQALASWAEQTTGLPVIFGSDQPDQPVDAPGYVQLETVRVTMPDVAGDPNQARVNAQVMITVQGRDHANTAELLTQLMLAALSSADWSVQHGAPDLALWSALGRPSRPAFVISISVRAPLLRQSAPPVRSPLEVKGAGLRRVQGRVLAADGTPLAGARVRLSPNGHPMTTAYDGRWTLVVPTTPVHLDIAARGVAIQHELPGSPTSAAETGIDIDRGDIDIVVAAVGASTHHFAEETEN